MRSPSCVSVYPPYQLLNVWSTFMKPGMQIMATEPILTAYSINPSSVCLSVCVSLLMFQGNGLVKYRLSFVARQRLGKQVPIATTTCHNRRTVGRVIFYAVCVLSEESPWVCLRIPLTLIGNNSVKTFPWQEELLKASFSMRSVSYQRKVGD
jgi:hypothetical protein